MNDAVSIFWWRWLIAVNSGVLLFSLVLMLLPSLTRQFFSQLLLASPDRIDQFGAEAVAYITFAHSVLGAVMFGWGIALMFILYGAYRRGERAGWQALVVSLATWFFPDSLISLWLGYWQNAVLNLIFAVLFAIPLAASYRMFHR